MSEFQLVKFYNPVEQIQLPLFAEPKKKHCWPMPGMIASNNLDFQRYQPKFKRILTEYKWSIDEKTEPFAALVVLGTISELSNLAKLLGMYLSINDIIFSDPDVYSQRMNQNSIDIEHWKSHIQMKLLQLMDNNIPSNIYHTFPTIASYIYIFDS